MKERPILFCGDMVKAVLNGTKTQTRRILNPQPPEWVEKYFYLSLYDPVSSIPEGDQIILACEGEEYQIKFPYGVPGDRLWVRESGWKPPILTPKMLREGADTWPKWVYTADESKSDIEQWKEWGWTSTPSIHMPRWASRINLEVTDVRVERVQDISEEDARAEGCKRGLCKSEIEKQLQSSIIVSPRIHEFLNVGPYQSGFRQLWDSINGHPRKDGVDISWAANPWVWKISFKKLN